MNSSEFTGSTLCYEDILYNVTVSQENQTTLHKSTQGPHKVIFHNIEPDAETVISVTSHDDNQTFSSVTQPEMSPDIGMLFYSQVRYHHRYAGAKMSQRPRCR